jgi:cytoplasmic iron level regulating protein YaaA (DUF328/UPF0246 family)
VLILLPPSEGKTAPGEGAPVELAALSHPGLTPQRERVLGALIRTSGQRSAKRALDALGLSPGQAGELARNAGLREAPAAPAADVYTGVLFERLGLPSVPAQARANVLIASALWGVVRPDDRIPAYRLSISARLPRLPGLASFWRPHLTRALPGDGLVVDLRSGGYAAAWKPASADVVGVRAFGADGKVVTHNVKSVRGDVARALLTAPRPPRSPEDVAEIAARAGHDAVLERDGTGWTLDVRTRAGPTQTGP